MNYCVFLVLSSVFSPSDVNLQALFRSLFLLLSFLFLIMLASILRIKNVFGMSILYSMALLLCLVKFRFPAVIIAPFTLQDNTS